MIRASDHVHEYGPDREKTQPDRQEQMDQRVRNLQRKHADEPPDQHEDAAPQEQIRRRTCTDGFECLVQPCASRVRDPRNAVYEAPKDNGCFVDECVHRIRRSGFGTMLPRLHHPSVSF